MAELTVQPSSLVPGFYIAVCALHPAGWHSLERPEVAQAEQAGLAHMARIHAGQWSGKVERLDVTEVAA